MKPFIFKTVSKFTGRVRFQANARSCTYVGSFATEEEAKEAARVFIATGTRPAKQRRGPKRGQPQTNPSPRVREIHVRARVIAPEPAPVDRLAMMRRIARQLA